MATISFSDLQKSTREKTPMAFQPGGAGGEGGFGAATVPVQQIEPIYIQIDGLKPTDTFLADNRSEKEVYDLLGIDQAKKTNNYKGPQILVNSDRIILNSYGEGNGGGFTMLFAKQGFVFSSPGTFNVDTDEEITLFGNEGIYLGVPNKGLPFEEKVKKTEVDPNAEQVKKDEEGQTTNPPKPAVTGSGTITDPTTVTAGTDPPPSNEGSAYEEEVKAQLSNASNAQDVSTPDRDYDPLILGNKLADWLSDLVLVIQTLQINTPSGQGYVSAGDSQYNLKKLNARIPEMISTFAYIDGRSHLPVDDPGPPPPPDPNDSITSMQAGVLGTGDSAAVVNADGATGPIGDIPLYTWDQLSLKVASLGLPPLDAQFCLVGIRSNADAFDKFDDMLIVIVNKVPKHFTGTTHPGKTGLMGGFKEYKQTGTAVLQPGRYNAHGISKHHGEYDAGRQTETTVTVLRDGNLTQKAGDVPATTAITGMYGINVHRASAGSKSNSNDNWSAGCQVFNDPTQFQYFITNFKASGKKILQYTLLQQFGAPPQSY